MDILLQQVFNGLTLGSIYALVALGYTMVYGIMGLINFAHGEVVMIGALSALAATKPLAASGLPGPLVALLALAVAVLVCMALGFTIERIAYRPLRNAPRLAPLITAIGVSIVLQQVAMLIWGRNYFSVPSLLPAAPHDVFGAEITDLQILIMVVAALTMAGLMLLVNRTRLGRAMRATAENPAIAGLMGVDANRIVSLTFVIGSALAALAGVLVSANYGIAHYQMGFILGLKAFTAAVLGGIGNLAGAMLGGVLLGVIEALGAGYIGDATNVCTLAHVLPGLGDMCAADPTQSLLGSNYQDVFAFFVLIVVLIFRPSGLMGEKVSERA
ncbi:MAG: branched-chain amino acid ABC transporter permease [Rhodocyclaceae bacterium]|nr:branched-chain amino acid ABC transporter permease [Rhodocyclaceae bacterium]